MAAASAVAEAAQLQQRQQWQQQQWQWQQVAAAAVAAASAAAAAAAAAAATAGLFYSGFGSVSRTLASLTLTELGSEPQAHALVRAHLFPAMPWTCQHCGKVGEGSRSAVTIPWTGDVHKMASAAAEKEGQWAAPVPFRVWGKEHTQEVSLLVCDECSRFLKSDVEAMTQEEASRYEPQEADEEAVFQRAIEASLREPQEAREEEELMAAIEAYLRESTISPEPAIEASLRETQEAHYEEAELQAAIEESARFADELEEAAWED